MRNKEKELAKSGCLLGKSTYQHFKFPLYKKSRSRNLERPCLFFLDEIEMALHPSSLKRLVNFLGDMAKAYNYAIYFSTHSIELIGNISPENIYFLDRHSDNSIEILNPCYPAYATRIL